VPLVDVMREDEARPCLSQEDMLANVPDRMGAFARVPRIIED
jgi:Asp-tRNA(Asn)/Glu-tRNA(Gln) amidotransferase C subunit